MYLNFVKYQGKLLIYCGIIQFLFSIILHTPITLLNIFIVISYVLIDSWWIVYSKRNKRVYTDEAIEKLLTNAYSNALEKVKNIPDLVIDVPKMNSIIESERNRMRSEVYNKYGMR